MEGRRGNFDKVLKDFEARLRTAEFVALDTELTGVDIEGEPDSFEETPVWRLSKLCQVAERFTLIQVGLTIVRRVGEIGEGKHACASYNFFVFPHVGPELLGREPSFQSQAAALRFNAIHHVDFNAWISDGVSYMAREDEQRYLATGKDDPDIGSKTGMLRLWKVLCRAQLPIVVHCPIDLFFLLAAFERRSLPQDPKALASLIRRLTPKVYDTAHLHGVIGRFRHLGLTKFFDDAKAWHGKISLQGNGNGNCVEKVEFVLHGDTEKRYGVPSEQLAHEAGFDSLVTAQLFVYLRAIAPTQVREGSNRLFLYRSSEFLDLDRAFRGEEIGRSVFDLSRVTLLVAELDPSEREAPKLLWNSGYSTCRWIDPPHVVLVVLRASGGAAVRKAEALARQVRGVSSWKPFDVWRAERLRIRSGEIVQAVDEKLAAVDSTHSIDVSSKAVAEAASEGALACMSQVPTAVEVADPASVAICCNSLSINFRWFGGVSASLFLFFTAIVQLWRRRRRMRRALASTICPTL